MDYEESLPPIPPLPDIASDDEEENPSHHLQQIWDITDYPPVFAPQSWTKTVSEMYHEKYYKPSETIGANFTLSAIKLRIQDLMPPKKKSCAPLGRDGKIKYPPRKHKYQEDEEDRIREMERKKVPGEFEPKVVKLEDLLSGKYWERENEKKRLKRLEKKMQKKMARKEISYVPDEKKILEKKQAILPKTPDYQKRILIRIVEREMKKTVRPEDIHRIYWYLRNGISNDFIAPFNGELFKKAVSLISPKLRNITGAIWVFQACQRDLLKYYVRAMRYNLLFYLLKNPAERIRLRIEDYPTEYPILVIRAPVPWHIAYVLGQQKFERRYCVSDLICIKIRQNWNKNFDHLYVVDFKKIIENHDGPLEINELEKLIDESCAKIRYILENKWILSTADIFVDYRKEWWKIVPKRQEDSTITIERLFNCVAVLMSLQVKSLVLKTLEHFLEVMRYYKDGNDYGPEYYDLAVINDPFIQVKPKLLFPEDPESKDIKIIFEPSMKELELFVTRVVDKILKVGTNLARVENIMFPEFGQRNTHLSAVNKSDIPNVYAELKAIVEKNVVAPPRFIEFYDSYMYIVDGTAKNEVVALVTASPMPFLKDFARVILRYDDIKKKIIFWRRRIPLNLIMLEAGYLNDEFYNVCHDLRNIIIDFFMKENRKNNRSICEAFEEMCQNSSASTDTVAQLVELQNYIGDCRDVALFNLREQIRKTAEYVLFLFDYTHFAREDISLNSRVFLWPSYMENVIDLANTRLNMKREQAENNLKAKRVAFDKKLIKHEKLLAQLKKRDPVAITLEELRLGAEEAEDLMDKIQADKREAENINEEEQLLDFDITPFMSLTKMLGVIDNYHKLWTTCYDFSANYELWYYGPFNGLDAEEIADYTENAWKILYKLGKQMADNPAAKRVADSVRSKIEKFKQFLPVLITVCNKGLQPRHYELISGMIGAPFSMNEESTLNDMIELGLPKVAAQLEELSGTATKEYELEKSLRKMQSEWADVKFELSPYRDTGSYILCAIDDIQLMMDDHLLKAQTMRGSPFARPYEDEVIRWEQKLSLMQDILDQWMTCQLTWMYLGPIFSSEDIMRQMPIEARNFKTVDKIWSTIMANTFSNPRVLVATEFKNMLQLLKNNNKLLDEVQRGLNDYLEKKRLFFPRFFFLSNDELLEILSETKDPYRVQPHLKKCFDGIYKLDFNDDEEVLGMGSEEGEIVPLSKKIIPADAKGMVEKWLIQVEEIMVLSLMNLAAKCLGVATASTRQVWISSWPGQVIQCCNMIQWTTEVTDAILNHTLPEQVNLCNLQIEENVKMVQSPLTPALSNTVEALIITDVHARDVVEILAEANVGNIAEFMWISQMRFYANIDETVTVSMITTDVMYAFEYLGNYTRLVATPLTDRCFRTLMGALKLNLGGAPEGPAGTGKTETCKDLAKVVAKKVVVFNCSDSMDYKALGKFFKGLAQSGAWACFDEFNRIELEVLSVVAQQILCIQMAIAAKLKKFIFEGTELTLNPTCTCFITMNPGYAGRTELPDNLKVLFRTVAMMVPDYALIGETTLYSYGFLMSKKMAQKIVYTYKLCSEQLSSQNHYDYGMRAVKSVLLAAGALIKQYPKCSEDQLILRAIIDVNLPKFLNPDIPLFEGIIGDLFPGVEIPQFERSELIVKLIDEIQKKNLQATPWFVEKVMQVYEMILVRHGLMVVGKPMGGKTCAYQNLADALSALALEKMASLKENKTIYKIINPKAITMGELYGQFDLVSHEWSDGVLCVIFREFANSPSLDRKWILFDGPVDAVWIENMNTVLDDNKKLCLNSGEIIQMSRKMNLIFEPADLEQASPATVSRCGMIYMEPELLGWEPLRDSYMQTLGKTFLPDQIELIEECLEWLVPPCLDYIKRSCKRFVENSETHQFWCFTKIFSCILAEEKNTQVATTWLQSVLIFCLAWGFGSTLTLEGQKTFDAFYRKVLSGEHKKFPKPKSFKLSKSQIFPDRSCLFEYVYDKRNNGQWLTWVDTGVVGYQIPANAKVSELIIQTNQSCLQKYFLRLYMINFLPILFVGPTGTGKTAVIMDFLVQLPKEKYLANIINFSARTTSTLTQEMVMAKLDKRRRGYFGPSMGKKCLLFVDDVGMPQKEVWGAQPPIELLRMWIDHGHWYAKDNTTLYLLDMMFVGAMGPPGGGRNEVTDRLLRHTLMIGIDSFNEETLFKIFITILDWHFSKGFDLEFDNLKPQLVGATLEVYKTAILKFLPTPAKSHYTFSLRDFSRVIVGCMMIPSSRMKQPEKMMRLWVHETYRVFHDRLIDDADRMLLFKMVETSFVNNLRKPLEQVCARLLNPNEKLTPNHIRNLIFGNYMDPDADPKIYDEVLNLDELVVRINFYLGEYNMISKSPMNLVMFQFAIEHISRVSRVLTQPNGNVLLVGMGGSGRHSAVRLAASMAEQFVYEIEIGKTYGITEWRDDVKKLLLKAGKEGKPIAFLFADTQVVDEMFVEDINTILNTADVPNLYQPDEKAEILEKMQAAARESGRKIDTTPLALYNFFIERVKTNLHVALAFSPIGESFRVRCRMFPSLINCCTIDWFTKWPEDALEKVAEMFLKQTDLTDDLIDKCTSICKFYHMTVENTSQLFYKEQKRITYITPTSYLEMIQTFKTFYYIKVDEITNRRDRYLTGLDKLDFATQQVGIMQNDLTALQPLLLEASAKTDKLLVKIEKDTIEAEKQKEIVGADEAIANEAAAAAQAIKDDCESDLSEAIPALNAALEALDTLKPADITLVKSMKNPPGGVKLVMEAVCVMKQMKPDRKPDPQSGKMVEDYWGPSTKLLADLKFLDSLRNFDKDHIPAPVMKRIREKFMTDSDFVPERIKTISTACEGLCKWVRAMEVYDRVIKVVAPKQAALQEAEDELAAQMATLNLKRAQLKTVLDKLQALNDELAGEQRKKKQIEDDVELTSQKLIRAEQLIGGLGGEKSRWTQAAFDLNESLGNVIGDVVLASGCVAYLGPFSVNYRTVLLKNWNQYCISLKIPCSQSFALRVTLGNPVDIRNWNLAGLPVDNFSVENGIIATKARRWPLMIDPQEQANKWIKNMEKAAKLFVIKLTDSNYLRVMENAITFGIPVLLENIREEIDAALDPVLTKNVFKQRNNYFLKLGDSILEYNQNFRFYVTTRLRNPHYLPELAVKVTLVNFMITTQGLQDQLLGIVVARELPVLEEKNNNLIIENARNKNLLDEIEDRILKVLSSSEGNILEDETAIKILSSSKEVSAEIAEKQKAAAVTEKEIEAARSQYIPVSTHSAVLFFCISELANIEPMYQYSLAWFINLFHQSITNSEKSNNVDLRINILNNHFTNSIYRNICRSLFEKDKLIFSFVLTISIMRFKGTVDEDVWSFLLTGGVGLENPFPNPAPAWLTDKSWSEVVRASHLKGLKKFKESFDNSIDDWKKFYDLLNPHDNPMPAPMDTVKGLHRLVALRCVRPDKIVPAVGQFIVSEMGPRYLEPPQFNLQESYNDSNCCSPLIFILSPGSDPMAGLIKFAADKGIQKTSLMVISLGQGQGPIAAGMIDRGLVTGQWVVLQNCHVATSWLKELERICSEVIVPENTHPDFRLWLTSYPSNVFPVPVLQNGVKMTNEAPKGLRLNLLRSYSSDPISNPEFYNSVSINWRPFHILLLALCFFHALIQERRKFGPLGWNIPYEFNESDLSISILQLQMFLNDYREVPYEALTYLTGECNYGGRVTDDKDRRLLKSLLSIFYTPEAIYTPLYAFSASGVYYVPRDSTYEGCLKYIKSLPAIPHPEIFGLHENADITKDNNETAALLSGTLLTQVQLAKSGGGGDDGDQGSIVDLAKDILEKLPDAFNIEEVSKMYPIMYTNSMNTVLKQELIRFNKLTNVVKRFLRDMIRAVQGLVVMSRQLEGVVSSLSVGKVPAAWMSSSYPSLKPLGSYIVDLLQRLNYFQDWIDNGPPDVFWLSGFFFTQSFLTGVTQNYSRKIHVPIDALMFEFFTTPYEKTVDELPDIGVYCKGLYLEGARFDRGTMMLAESWPKILFDTVPIIWLKPIEKKDYNPPPHYDCPIYKTLARRGVLSTTGHSTNFVMFTTFDSDLPQRHWINRGVACLCALDD